ncbi:MAG TPA: 30S ribosome-binding factor RbfA [Rhodospirillaceae bacterium]|nr:30S ribosome-binding factor RbfA [Rhodospirillaceae bacterium]
MSRKSQGSGRGGIKGRAPSQRQLRVGEEIRHALSEIVRRTEFRDTELANMTITVTEVRVSPDMRNATVFVLPLEGAVEPMVAGLNRASAYLRGQLGRAVRMKYLPALSFVHDRSFDEASRIEAIMHRPEVARDIELNNRETD